MKTIRDYTADLLEFLFKDEFRTKIVLLNLFLLVALIFFRSLLVMVFFILLGGFSMSHMKYTRSYFGFELCTFGTVFCAMQYGALVGMVVGVVSISIGLFITAQIDEGMLFSMMGFFLVGLFASFFPLSSLFWVGVVAALLYDVFILSYYFIRGSNPVSCTIYFITHMYSTVLIFSKFAPWLLQVFA